MPVATPPLHLRVRGSIEGATERLALRAALTAAHLFGLAAGVHLRSLRALKDPLADLQARLQEADLRARLAWEVVEILAARFAKIPERHRPYFTPPQRFRVLEIRNLLAWSAQDTARVFLLCPNTVLNWERVADPEQQTVGSLVKPIPPVRRAADVVRSLVQTMTRLGFGGQDLVARVLARAGWRVSARSIGRYRKERIISVDPTPDRQPTRRKTHPVVARFVHHTWMMDVSQVKQLLGPDLFMAAVFDAFSRVPLGVSVSSKKPKASDMARLFRRTLRSFARPKYLITDLGGEFIGNTFIKTVARLGVVQRLASADNLYATARLERWWRTAKESTGLYRLHLPLTAADLEERLELALTHYVCFRPHEGLKGATPAEAFLGIEPACHRAVEPPRGRSGEGAAEAPFEIERLRAADARFPILKPAA